MKEIVRCTIDMLIRKY